MRFSWSAVLVVALLFSNAAKSSAITIETFVPVVINYPGANSTQARGINGPGEVVGTYFCPALPATCINSNTGEVSSPGTHGFLLQSGVYVRIDVPGATLTLPRGISDQGVIVGQYIAGGVTHGFTYRDGDWEYPIDVPAALFDNLASPFHTLAVGISPQGELVGCFHEGTAQMTTMHGWLRRHGEFIRLATPKFPGDTTSDPDTMNNGIAATGTIVGFYLSDGVSYVADEGGIVTTFTVDGNLFTHAWGTNARGDIVGVYGTNQAGIGGGGPTSPKGFLRTKDGSYLGLAVKDASNTQVFGINSAGDIVGQYTDGTGTHGFTYRPARGKP